MLDNGIRTNADLMASIGKMQRILYSENPGDIEIKTPFERELFIQATGYTVSKWTRIDPDRIISEFKEARSRGRVGEVAQGYEQGTMVIGKVDIKFDHGKIEKEFMAIRAELLEASKVKDAGQEFLSNIKAKTTEALRRKLSALQQTLDETPNKFIEAQLKEIQETIGRIESGKNTEKILVEILGLSRKDIETLELHTVIREIVLSKIFERNYSPEMINTLITQLQEGISVQSVMQVSNLLDNVIKDHILNIEKNNKDGYWSKEAWARIKEAKGKAKTMDIRKLFTETTLKFRETISEFETSQSEGMGRTIQVIPDRSIVGEMSGYLANACYTKEYPLLSGRPNLTPYKFIDRTDPSNPELIGSVLVFEVETASRGKAMLIRAFNVPNETRIDIPNFIEKFIDTLESTARRRGVDSILYAGAHGADSNYPFIQSYLSRYKRPERLVPLKDKFDFNGYDITNASYLVRDISGESSQ